MTLRHSALIAISLALTLGGCNPTAQAERPPLEGTRVGGAFTLTDKAGKVWHWQDFTGKYRIVYFGYAYCPDVCPVDVAQLIQGLNRFATAQPKLAKQIQPIFITIDPARDTKAVVGEFAAAFSPDLLGLTGTDDQIKQAAKAFSVYYAKGKAAGDGYLMDHSRIAFLMGKQGEPIAMLPVDQGAAAVAEELAKWVK